MKTMKTMRKKFFSVVVLIGIFWLLVSPAHAEEASTAKVSGLLFGDYYWFAKNNAPANEGQTGFWVRRAYLTVDNDLSSQFSARLQLEMNQKDFTDLTGTSTTTAPFIKNAYLKYTHSQHNIFLGISGTPTWNLVETHWGYRSIEKTPLDLYKLGNPVDGGISVWGHLDQESQWGYQLMVGNGSGSKSETNKDKKYYLAVSNEPSKKLVFQLYGDYENRAGTNPVYSLQGFVGLKGVSGRGGILYARNRADQKIDLASLYGVANLKENVALIVRG
ncbi:MAG: hypothetical protein HY037_02365 [Nitrospirae bacterium]|nr:hypothetical protein [Candidatus Troglogloeales bacterium]